MQPCSRHAQQVLRHEVEQVIHFLRQVCLAVRSVHQRQQSALLARAHLVEHTEFQHRAGKARQNAHRTLVVGALSSQCLPEFAHLAPYGIQLALKVLLVHGIFLQGACPERITRGSHATLHLLARGVRSSILLRALTQQHIHTGLVGSTLGGIAQRLVWVTINSIVFSNPKFLTLHDVTRKVYWVFLATLQTLLAPPQHVAQFVVAKLHPLRQLQRTQELVNGFQHLLFQPLPHTALLTVKVFKILLCQARQIFIGGFVKIPIMI